MRYLFFFLTLVLMSAAQAAEPAPGDVCSAAGATTASNNSGVGNFMVCQGGSWKAVYSYNAAGNLTKLGNVACNAGEFLKFDGTKWICAAGSAYPPCKADMTNAQIGDTCDDGSKFLGSHPNFSWQGFYAADADQSGGTTWDIALTLCGNLVAHGHDDWYLPSLIELQHLYANKSLIGGFNTDPHWSSGKDSTGGGWMQNFDSGTLELRSKNQNYDVRCVRRG